MKTIAKSTKVNNVVKLTDALKPLPTTKATTTKVVEAKNPTTGKVEVTRYLINGVTGKQMMRSIFDANNAHKQDLGSFNQCLKRAIEFGESELTKTIKGFKVADMNARNLIALRNAKKTAEDKWSVYEVLMLTKKFYQNKK
jgi:hypothetical protein